MSDLPRALEFYCGVLGFSLVARYHDEKVRIAQVAAQIGERPPRFAIQVNSRNRVTRDYGYFVENRLRDRYGLQGVPVIIDFNERGSRRIDTLVHDLVEHSAAAGDIGEMFSDRDPANRGRDSLEMLRSAVERVRAMGWRVANADVSVAISNEPASPGIQSNPSSTRSCQ